MALHPISGFFRPKKFLHFISLLTATEFITISLLINKVEGVYGILALFTGYHLSALQLSMYLYSIVIFGLVCYLSPHIRRQSPLQTLCLAWIYILDTLINAAYTTLFGLSWFIILAQHLNPSDTEGDEPLGATPPGGKMINDTAGFTDPEAVVDKVEVIATPKPGLMPGQDAVAYGVVGDGNSFGNVFFESGSLMSVTVISSLWFIRLYFVVIVMAYARGVLRQAMASTPPQVPAGKVDLAPDAYGPPQSAADRNPFHPSLPAGQGWQGQLGRILVSFPSSYWLGKDEADEEWVRGADERFRRYASNRQPRGPLIRSPPPPTKGTSERERRARSGTGPPPPGLDVRGQGRGRKSEGTGSGSDK
ncbi:DUF1753-domain-containing protein [Myriangium duriaei CBS 260.36]|uniref:DUF1753-domain-containing protein n=1 Tax=Myriangium duriaei CBS 260.36 TaxID=1168546 RepID=A0A9P4J2Z1_9PEZI|nr:DUF1753-domain-containing protein [Myriangium duriaei CBS 260.36]